MTLTLFNNFCKWSSTTSGTTAFTVGAAAAADDVGSHDIPANCYAADGTVYRYYAQSPDGLHTEMGRGAYSVSSGTLARTEIIANSDGTTTPVNFTADPIVDMFPLPFEYLSFQQMAAGTIMLFQQSAAPPGWTKLTTHNDKVLRVVSGTASVGGSNAFSTVMAQTVVGNHTLGLGEITNHNHSAVGGGPAGCCSTPPDGVSILPTFGGKTSGTTANGGSGAHNHPILMDVLYVDMILASKN